MNKVSPASFRIFDKFLLLAIGIVLLGTESYHHGLDRGNGRVQDAVAGKAATGECVGYNIAQKKGNCVALVVRQERPCGTDFGILGPFLFAETCKEANLEPVEEGGKEGPSLH